MKNLNEIKKESEEMVKEIMGREQEREKKSSNVSKSTVERTINSVIDAIEEFIPDEKLDRGEVIWLLGAIKSAILGD